MIEKDVKIVRKLLCLDEDNAEFIKTYSSKMRLSMSRVINTLIMGLRAEVERKNEGDNHK
jgi:hypothetical protein